jgi:hypothetical protein
VLFEVTAPIWTILRRAVLPAGNIIAIRLGEGNNGVLKYFLLPRYDWVEDSLHGSGATPI